MAEHQKNRGTDGKSNAPKGYYKDANGKWHRPNGQFARNTEIGLPSSRTKGSNKGPGSSDSNIVALNELISELNGADGAKTIADVNILKKWVNEYGVVDKFNYVQTPYGYALQSLSDNALDMRKYVNSDGDLYRGGTIGRSKTIDAQFWATESPLTDGYADKYGVDFKSMEFIQSGVLNNGTNFITRPAPALNGNKGGGIEVVTPSGTVKLNSFNMLD